MRMSAVFAPMPQRHSPTPDEQTLPADSVGGGGVRGSVERSFETGATGLEPATSGVTGRRSNQLNYAPWAGRV